MYANGPFSVFVPSATEGRDLAYNLSSEDQFDIHENSFVTVIFIWKALPTIPVKGVLLQVLRRWFTLLYRFEKDALWSEIGSLSKDDGNKNATKRSV